MKKIKRPDSINILGIDYKITYLDSPENDSLARCDNNAAKITFFSDLQPDGLFLQTLIHEIIHAIDFQVSAMHMKTEKECERITNRLACGITQVLLQNQKVFKGFL